VVKKKALIQGTPTSTAKPAAIWSSQPALADKIFFDTFPWHSRLQYHVHTQSGV